MSAIKTTVNNKSAEDFISAVPDDAKRSDSMILLELFSRITGEKPKMWGSSIIGFGQYHYQSERSRREGDWPLIGFSPRKQNLTLYFMFGFAGYQDLLGDLGKHQTSVSCLYIRTLADIKLPVLAQLIEKSFSAMKKKYQ